MGLPCFEVLNNESFELCSFQLATSNRGTMQAHGAAITSCGLWTCFSIAFSTLRNKDTAVLQCAGRPGHGICRSGARQVWTDGDHVRDAYVPQTNEQHTVRDE
eukprot:RCo048868